MSLDLTKPAVGSTGWGEAVNGNFDAIQDDLNCRHAVQTTDTSVHTTTSVIPLDDTIPQNTEGTEIMTVSITPTSADSTLLIEVMCHVEINSSGVVMIGALFQDSDADAIGATKCYSNANADHCMVLRHVMTAGTTSETTFKFRVGVASSYRTLTVNGRGGSRVFGGTLESSIRVTELPA